MSYREFPQEPYPPPGYGGPAPPQGGQYPSAVPPPFGPPFDGYPPGPPPPPQHVHHQRYDGGYQGYFNEGYPPGPPPPPQHMHHQNYEYQDYDSGCSSLIRGCLAAAAFWRNVAVATRLGLCMRYTVWKVCYIPEFVVSASV